MATAIEKWKIGVTLIPAQRCLFIMTRMCLVLSLWQAPVPWFHCHEMNASGPEETIGWLQHHLAILHQETDLRADHDPEWHFHWIVPSWSHAVDNTPDDEPPEREVIAFDQVTISPSDSDTDHCQLSATINLPGQICLVPPKRPVILRATACREVAHGKVNSVLRC